MKCKDTKSEIARLNRKIAELERKQKQTVTGMGILRFMLFVGCFLLVLASWNALVWSWEWLGVPFSLLEESQPQHLLVLGPVVLLMVSVMASAVSFCAWVKRGYGNLESVDDEGLIGGLIWEFD